MLCDLKVDSSDLHFDRFEFDLEAVVKNAIRRVLTPGRAWHYYMRTLDGVELVGSEFRNILPETLSQPITTELLGRVRENVSQTLRADKRLNIGINDVKVTLAKQAGRLGIFVEVRYRRGADFELFSLVY